MPTAMAQLGKTALPAQPTALAGSSLCAVTAYAREALLGKHAALARLTAEAAARQREHALPAGRADAMAAAIQQKKTQHVMIAIPAQATAAVMEHAAMEKTH